MKKSNLNNEEIKQNTDVQVPVDNDIVDVSFDTIKKKKFRIDGDNDRILELDTSDFSVMNRIEEVYPKLVKLGEKASSLKIDENAEEVDVNVVPKLAQTLKEIDADMRGIIDYIFDSDVASKCAPSGSMFDLFNGEFRYEHIMDKLTQLYESNLSKEFELFNKRINKHTDKYVRR